jgi:hypothetical protein
MSDVMIQWSNNYIKSNVGEWEMKLQLI